VREVVSNSNFQSIKSRIWWYCRCMAKIKELQRHRLWTHTIKVERNLSKWYSPLQQVCST